jgi:hypothetical protein
MVMLVVCGVAPFAVSCIPRPEGVGYQGYVQHKVLPAVLTLAKGSLTVLFMTAWGIFLFWVFALVLGLFGMGLDWIGRATIWALVAMVVLLTLWLRFFARRT